MEKLGQSKKKLQAIRTKALIVLGCLIGAGLFFESKKVFWGIVIGGALSLCNLFVLTKIGENIFYQTNPQKTPIIISYVLKILIFFSLLFFLITYDLVNIVAFVVGFSSIFLAIGIEAVFPSRNTL